MSFQSVIVLHMFFCCQRFISYHIYNKLSAISSQTMLTFCISSSVYPNEIFAVYLNTFRKRFINIFIDISEDMIQPNKTFSFIKV